MNIIYIKPALFYVWNVCVGADDDKRLQTLDDNIGSSGGKACVCDNKYLL